MSAKRDCSAMDMDMEESASKKQCVESFQESFADALEEVQKRALQDRDYLVKKACEYYVQRNECKPSVDELQKVFEDLAEKFSPEDAESSSESEQDDESDSSSEDENVEEFAELMAKGEMNELDSALKGVADLAKAQKQELKKKIQEKFKELEGQDITAEETEAVFALVGSMFKQGADYEVDEENDADYEPTDSDKAMEKEDEEVEESEGEEETFHMKLAGELEHTSATTSMADAEEEALEEAEFDEIEKTVAKQLLQLTNKFLQGADAEDVTGSLKEAKADSKKNKESQPEEEEEFDEAEVEKSDFMKAAVEAFTEANGFAPSASDKAKIVEQWATMESEDESEEDSASEFDDEDEPSSGKTRPAGSVEKMDNTIQEKQASAMDIEQTEAPTIVA